VTTTAVFAEIIVVGLQVEAWIALLVLTIWGTDWVDLDALEPWAALVTILVVATAYVLGIVIDRVSDRTVMIVAKKVGRRLPNGTVSFQEQRLSVLDKSDGMAKFLDYQRSRQRVARGTVVNTTAATLTLVAFLWVRTDVSAWWLLAVVGTGVLALAGAMYTNERIYRAYTKNLEAAYRLTLKRTPKIVAAVAYRRKDKHAEPRFLLVRTKGRDKWTFPKGHVEEGEDPAWAALREAEEEAGIVGKIDPAPLAEYYYPDTRGGRGDDLVAAYLLKVLDEEQGGPAESFRQPTWVTRAEAEARFAEGGREPRFVNEHKRVLERAVRRLGR
jgi:8-oxo-dGTP pyrophosphatase MutT (NUDIX family)